MERKERRHHTREFKLEAVCGWLPWEIRPRPRWRGSWAFG